MIRGIYADKKALECPELAEFRTRWSHRNDDRFRTIGRHTSPLRAFNTPNLKPRHYQAGLSEAQAAVIISRDSVGRGGRPCEPETNACAGQRGEQMEAMKNISIDGARLWESLMEMAKIGATEKGGNCRLALTDLDREGRDLFVRWCEAAGCTVSVDAMGNIFARRPGRDPG